MILILLFILHYCFDFVGQTRETAESKSYDLWVLYKHCFNYAFFITFYVSLYLVVIVKVDKLAVVEIFSLLFFGHFIIDFVTSKLTKKFWLTNKKKHFWNTIGADQLLHSIILIVINNYFV